MSSSPSDHLRPISVDPAYVIFIGFLVSIFFLNGGIGNAVVIICFLSAWVVIIVNARAGHASLPKTTPLLLLFLIAVTLRLLLPPYGTQETVPGTAVTRALLLVGLYGLIFYVQKRIPFRHVLWLVAAAAFLCTAVAIVAFLLHPTVDGRMSFFGRASHPIFGAGAMASGVIAALALLMHSDKARSPAVIAIPIIVTGVLLFGIVLTASRGPLLALAAALFSAPIVMLTRSRTLLVAAVFGAWALVTSSVLLEAPIKQALCPIIQLACRASLRHDVWAASAEMIAAHPLWGSGYAFRFKGVPHAHNAHLGMALHYGIPLSLLFAALIVAAVQRAADGPKSEQRFFSVTSLVFASGFMGSDLSDPMRFFNTHYLFFWFPMFLIFVDARCLDSELRPKLTTPDSIENPIMTSDRDLVRQPCE